MPSPGPVNLGRCLGAYRPVSGRPSETTVKNLIQADGVALSWSFMSRSGLGSALALTLACSPPSGDSGEPSETSADVATATQDVPTEPVDTVTTIDDEVRIDCPWDSLSTGPDDDMPTNGLHSQADVDTFAGCTDVKFNLSISSSEPLDLTPLASLRRITGDLAISGGSCHAGQSNGPTSLAGLESLREVRSLHLSCLRVTDLAPLAGLTTLERDLRIEMLPELTSLEGLHNVTSIGAALHISDCDKLKDLGGLRGLQRAGVRVFFGRMPITSLHGLEALTQVGEPGGESRVGLVSLPDLTSLDGFGIDWRPDHDIWLYGTGLTDMSALAGVSELTALNLGGNAALTSLTGLEQLTVVREALDLRANKNLVDITGLDNLESVGALILHDTSLTDAGPLPALTAPGDVRISNNEQLSSVSVLAGSTALRSLVLERNPALTGIPELTDLAAIEGDFELRNNNGLTDLDDLPALTKVGGRLAVVYHRELLQTDAEAWAAPIDAAERKIVGNKGYDVPPLDPCPWKDDGECDYDICIDDGWDCLSD